MDAGRSERAVLTETDTVMSCIHARLGFYPSLASSSACADFVIAAGAQHETIAAPA